METLAPSLQQFVNSEHEFLVDEVTQLGLIESCLLKMSQIKGLLAERQRVKRLYCTVEVLEPVRVDDSVSTG